MDEVKEMTEFVEDKCCPKCETSQSLNLNYVYCEVNPMIYEYKCSICAHTGVVSYKKINSKQIVMDQGPFKTKTKRKLLKKTKL